MTMTDRELIIKALRQLASSNRAEAGSPQGHSDTARIRYTEEAERADALADCIEGISPNGSINI